MTIFSAANYCGEFDNDGAVMSVDETLMCSFNKIKQANAQKKFAQSKNGGAGVNNYGKKFAATKFNR